MTGNRNGTEAQSEKPAAILAKDGFQFFA